MRASRNRRLAAGLAVLSMFSCSYGDREDKEEDEQAKRAEVILPPGDVRLPAERHVPGGKAVEVTLTLS
jgi:hypothetical protein